MPTDFKYKIVRVPATKQSIGTAKEKPSDDEAYEHVIHQYADDGWRLSEIWSPPGIATVWLDLIFEKEVKEHD